MYTKEEMEDIWNNKPVGFLKIETSRRKGLKKFSVVIQPYVKTLYDIHCLTVNAKNREDSFYQAKLEVAKLYEGKKIDGWLLQRSVPF